MGLSAIANMLGAIKYAKYIDLGENDVVMTVATDGANMYQTEMDIATRKHFAGAFDELSAAETYGQYILGTTIDHMLELNRLERERIFNLGYYTWVEQQGTTLEDFDRRRDQSFWDGLLNLVPDWDDMITRFNES